MELEGPNEDFSLNYSILFDDETIFLDMIQSLPNKELLT
jgi:hypothetical protein